MKKIKEDFELLLIYTVIGIVAAGITGWFLYQDRMEFWKAQACSTFRIALEKELQERSGIEMYLYMNGNVSLPKNSIVLEKEPITVSMESKHGKKDFVIPYEKHIHNIERSSDIRGMHSYLLHVQPLKADSLNRLWENLLAEMEFPGRTIVRTSVTDWWERETYAYSGDTLYVAKLDSLISYYMGYRCEIGVTGYMYYPWWVSFTLKDKVLLCVLVLACFLLFFIQEYVVRLFHRFFVKEVSTVIEKKVPVFVVEKSQSHIYRLEDNLYFDTDSGKLIKANACVKLSPLLAKLLQGFLEAENYRLSVNEILDLLWPNDVATSERVHTAIRRLRKSLSEISDWRIENGNSGYQLKSPHSIEEIEQ